MIIGLDEFIKRNIHDNTGTDKQYPETEKSKWEKKKHKETGIKNWKPA